MKISFDTKALMKNLERQLKDQKKAIEKWLLESQEIFMPKLQELSPTDTEKFIKNHKKSWIVRKWDVIETSIYNTTEYAWPLEIWVWIPFNYHKWPRRWKRTIIYSWIWNKTFERTTNLTTPAIIENFNRNVKI